MLPDWGKPCFAVKSFYFHHPISIVRILLNVSQKLQHWLSGVPPCLTLPETNRNQRSTSKTFSKFAAPNQRTIGKRRQTDRTKKSHLFLTNDIYFVWTYLQPDKDLLFADSCSCFQCVWMCPGNAAKKPKQHTQIQIIVILPKPCLPKEYLSLGCWQTHFCRGPTTHPKQISQDFIKPRS